MKILIADDDPMSRRLLDKPLLRAGYDVIAVQNGVAAAEELCRQDGPRLALLDWEMPELDGPAVCRKAFDSGELKARLRTGERILHLEGRLVEAREDLRFKATHDSLTSLFNRGVIVDLLGREISPSRREHVPVAILMSDVDHFKIINDTHGDEVLKEAARRLLLSVRSYDYVGRYGGEEFLIILNNCDPASTPRRAEEIRKALSDHPVETSAGPLLVPMSMGVHQTENWGEHTVEELLHQADSARYAAKAAGRNRISFTEPDGSSDAGQVAPAEAIQSSS
jgi:two-component system, cell cycle response regulator